MFGYYKGLKSFFLKKINSRCVLHRAWRIEKDSQTYDCYGLNKRNAKEELRGAARKPDPSKSFSF